VPDSFTLAARRCASQPSVSAAFASRPADRKDEAVAEGRRSNQRSRPIQRTPPSKRSQNQPRPGLARRATEPPVPEGVDTRLLHRSVRAELRGLPKELAEIVAAHLVAAGQLIDHDPELAYAHAEAARRRASRLPVVREAAAETAYAAGHYDTALSELRAIRRMTGSDDYLPMMADCERALGRPEAALKLAKEAKRLRLDPAQRVEMILVEAGARTDLGQEAEALRLLEAAIANLSPTAAPRIAAARLRYAYAEALLRRGSSAEARKWFEAAAELDSDAETDAQARVDELDGVLLNVDPSDLERLPSAENS
jgi:tetratricopeptide (TPR) repeat protein